MQNVIDAAMIYAGCRVDTSSELEDIDALVATYWPRVLRYVSFSINDDDLAQTITQDCFLKAYNGRASFRGDCAVSTWLIAIANNLVQDQVRLKKFQFWRKAHRTSVDVQEMASFLPSAERSAETKLLATEQVEGVKAALEELSVNQRRVVLLRFFEGMNIEEIAQATGMPANTVKTHMHRGITAIRAKLGAKALGGKETEPKASTAGKQGAKR
jgi:RNA polymerase sigma-70 factor (ECF subfamily)